MTTENRSRMVIELLFVLSLFLFVFMNQAFGAEGGTDVFSLGEKPSSSELLNLSKTQAENDLRELNKALKKVTEARLEATSLELEGALNFERQISETQFDDIEVPESTTTIIDLASAPPTK